MSLLQGYVLDIGEPLLSDGLAGYLNSFPYVHPGRDSNPRPSDMSIGCGNDALTDCATVAAPREKIHF